MQVWKKAFRAPATFHCRFHYVLPLRSTPDSSKRATEKSLKKDPFSQQFILPLILRTYLLRFELQYSMLGSLVANFYFILSSGLCITV